MFQFHQDDNNFNDFYGMSVRPGGSFLIAANADGKLFLSNWVSTTSTPTDAGSGLFACAFSRDSTYYASGANNGNIYMYNATGGNNSL